MPMVGVGNPIESQEFRFCRCYHFDWIGNLQTLPLYMYVSHGDTSSSKRMESLDCCFFVSDALSM